MNSPMSKFRAPLIAGLIVMGGALTPATAQAAACPVGSPGVPISTLANPPYYTCDIGGFRYIFDSNSQLNELTVSPTAELIFTASPTLQTLRFTNLANTSLIDFIYNIKPLTGMALDFQQTYTQTPSGSTPLENVWTTDPVFSPSNPTAMQIEVRATFEADNATLTELTHTIVKTPGPLPTLGAGVAFALSRKLRRRISGAS